MFYLELLVWFMKNILLPVVDQFKLLSDLFNNKTLSNTTT